MQETLQRIHAYQYSKRYSSVNRKYNEILHNINTTIGIPVKPIFKPLCTVSVKKTSDSEEWAKDKAQSRRYDAVFDIHPSTN